MTHPAGWARTRLKYVARCNADVLPEDTDAEFEFDYVDIRSVNQGKVSAQLEHMAFGAAPSRARRLAVPGDTVVSTVRTYLKAVALVPERDDAMVFSTGFAVLHPGPQVSERFLGYLIQSDAIIERVVANSTGVSYPAITAGQLMSLDVHLPDLPEQIAIADFLDRETAKIDCLIDKQAALIRGLGERRTASINHAIAGAPGVQGTPLRQVAEIQTGLTLGKIYTTDEAEEYPYLRVANVQVGWVDLADVATTTVPVAQALQVMLRTGDVLMTEGGDRAALGRGSLWRGDLEPCLHQNHVFALRPSSRLLPEYLVYVLEADGARRYFESTRRQTTNLSSTNSRLVRAFRMTLPSLDDQRRVVRELDAIAAQVSAAQERLERSIAIARERRAALVTAAVTGQLGVGKAA